ncbi:tRNA(adenine(34)) deaminase, chloroplastic-like protein [Drosera capensis]
MYTSSIISYKGKSSPCLSINGSSHYSNARHPSCCCYSCFCSYQVNPRWVSPININPSLVYGLRQSSLLGWSFSRRLGYGVRSSIYDPGCHCNGGSWRGIGDGRLGRRMGRVGFEVRVFEEGGECGAGDVEAMLGLLIEDGNEECFDVGERKWGSRQQRRFVDSVKVEDDGCRCGRGKAVSDRYKSDLEHRLKSLDVSSRKKGRHRREEQETLLKGVENRSRRERSSSSRYFYSGSDDFESDLENEELVEQALVQRRKDSRKRAGAMVRGKTEEGSWRRRGERNESYEDKLCDGVQVRDSAEGESRKRSERKLNEKSVHKAAFSNDSASRRSKISGSHVNALDIASTSRNQLNHAVEEEDADLNLLKESKTHSTRLENRVSGYSNASLDRRTTLEEETDAVMNLHEASRTHFTQSENRVSGYSNSSLDRGTTKMEAADADMNLHEQSRTHSRKSVNRVSRNSNLSHDRRTTREEVAVEDMNLHEESRTHSAQSVNRVSGYSNSSLDRRTTEKKVALEDTNLHEESRTHSTQSGHRVSGYSNLALDRRTAREEAAVADIDLHEQSRIHSTTQSANGNSEYSNSSLDCRTTREEEAADMNLHELSRAHSSRSAQRVIGYSVSGRNRRSSEESESWDAETASNSGTKLTGRKVMAASSDHCQTCGHVLGEDHSKSISFERNDRSEIREMSVAKTCDVERHSESRNRIMEEKSTLLENSTEEDEWRHRTSYTAAGLVNPRQRSQNCNEVAYSGEDYVVVSSISQQQLVTNDRSEIPEMRSARTSNVGRRSEVRVMEVKSTMLETSTEEADGWRYETSYTAAGHLNSRQKSQNYNELAYSDGDNLVASSSSQQQLATQRNTMEGTSSLSSSQEKSRQQYLAADEVEAHSVSEKESKGATSATVMELAKEDQTVIASRRESQRRTRSDKSYLTSKVTRVEDYSGEDIVAASSSLQQQSATQRNAIQGASSLISSQEKRRQQYQAAGEVKTQSESVKESEGATGATIVSLAKEETGIASRRESEQSTYSEKSYLTSEVNRVEAYGEGDNVVTSSSLQQKSETQGNAIEGTSSLIPSQEKRRKQFQGVGKVKSQSESEKESKGVTGATVVGLTKEEETVITSRRESEQRTRSEKSYATSKVNRMEEMIEKQEEVGEHRRLVKEPKQPIRSATFPALRETAGKFSSRLPMAPPPAQLAERDPPYVEPLIVLGTQDSIRTSEAGSSSLFVGPQSGSSSSHDETKGSSTSYLVPQQFLSHEDALDSAVRMAISSAQIVGEFVDHVRHEATSTRIQMGKESTEIQSAHDDKNLVQHKSKKREQGKVKGKKQDSRPSSAGSWTKGRSDETTQDVRAQTVAVPPNVEASGTTSAPGNPMVRRSGRSVWNILGDVFLFRWGAHDESQKPATKSVGQSSSNESASSEAWFSGNEPDETHNGNTKRTNMGLLLEPTPTQSRRKGSSAMSLTETVSEVEVDASVSLGSIRISSGAGDAQGESVLESNVDRQSMEPTTSDNLLLISAMTGFMGISGGVALEPDVNLIGTEPAVSINLPWTLSTHAGSQVMEEISEGSSTNAAAGATREELQQRIDNDSELIRRTKFQRKDQFFRERFDQWEEAYRQESKQRKIDEIFMREALVEAKKAADIWEVPVGAVLVQNGKITARAYNLVEELRDSTAHAEMICIREASKVLRSWRLSEATLYVTLEPCPMCAGAILQARIDTIVWGAPNKLLGADGSWMRLFPDGHEGDGRTALGDKPAAPVHPFHPNIKVRRGVLEPECADAMQQFFKLRRKKAKKTDSPPEQPSCLPVPHHPSKLLPSSFPLFFKFVNHCVQPSNPKTSL